MQPKFWLGNNHSPYNTTLWDNPLQQRSSKKKALLQTFQN